ncbi:MAG TPA: TIGR03668 family PPOX class F420-dependent oxidoreductase [Nitrososphaeraceae archaeon]
MIKNENFKRIINNARVARLAAIDTKCRPYLVPVVFVCDTDNHYYIPIDGKIKQSEDPESLKRVRNIKANPNVALLVDEYTEDWTKLYFIMIQGIASVISKSIQGSQIRINRVHKLLSKKYCQYHEVAIGESVIMICPQKVFTWKNQ